MNPIGPEVWIRLAADRVQGDVLCARRAAPDSSDQLIAAVDADTKRHFLVLLKPGEAEIQDSQSRGITVTSRALAVPGHETGKYLDVICHDPAGYDAFNLIGGELADRLGAGRETPVECISRVLAKWRRFWGQLPRQLLSKQQQIGLFAELWFLCIWMLPRVGATEAVNRWRGPFGSRHDFEWTGRSVEVKGTTSTRGRVHHINGIDQLAPPEQGDLLFFSLRLREEAGATNSLPLLIANCQSQLQPDLEALSRFERALAQIGYSPMHDEEYSKLHLRIVEEALFDVRENFPRVTRSQFSGEIPRGVELIEYEINLDVCDHLCLARTPESVQYLI